MDGFHAVLIKEKNQSVPQLFDIVEKRELEFKNKISTISPPPAISLWADRMKKRLLAKLGLDYVVYGHQPMDYVTALMCLRYGMDQKQWPKAFSPADLARALAWENGRIPGHVTFGENRYYPLISGGSELTDYMEAQIGNGLFRTGLSSIAPWSTPLTPAVGDIVQAVAWNDTMFECVVSGAVGGTEPAWNTTIGAETVDGGATWQAIKVGIPKRAHFIALFTAAPGETGGGTEVSGGAYARVQHSPTDTNWTASTAGRNDNASVIAFPAPTANWGTITDMAIMSRLTGGNYFMYSPLTTSKTVNNGDPAPTYPIGSLDVDFA